VGFYFFIFHISKHKKYAKSTIIIIGTTNYVVYETKKSRNSRTAELKRLALGRLTDGLTIATQQSSPLKNCRHPDFGLTHTPDD
jgi:hypothetical protein